MTNAAVSPKPKTDWTVKELANKAGVDPSYIRQLLLASTLKGYKRAGAWFISDREARRWLTSRQQNKEV